MVNHPQILGHDSVFTPEQVLENRGRVAIFIDGSNLFYAALQLGIEIDYTKLLCRLTAGSRLFRAFFYTGVDQTNEKQQGFLLWMRRNGYRVIAKDLIQLPDGSKKANLDVEIAVDMMALTGCYDTAVLVSGDGDLAYAVDAASYRGVRIEVVSLRSMTSDSLINVSDRYIDLDGVKNDIKKLPRHGAQNGYSYRPLSGLAVMDEAEIQP
ncbi:NYN domain-containing protein [Romeria aff. gracilis LEGE 07310]|uniref:NYN domain-containing protein n=1 Tax=Vasconcelosia minhoensis LEGE 07310 TaxID=915328 RepID=A0A8J7DKL3_9CYAN|nr:NYN domain-containing protein [Romeria gracilis]MBE9076596.1 NYN domain-containing protein [Romeria aff. gracilis LEGE 07310]